MALNLGEERNLKKKIEMERRGFDAFANRNRQQEESTVKTLTFDALGIASYLFFFCFSFFNTKFAFCHFRNILKKLLVGDYDV